jgi:hypothetical protein
MTASKVRHEREGQGLGAGTALAIISVQRPGNVVDSSSLCVYGNFDVTLEGTRYSVRGSERFGRVQYNVFDSCPLFQIIAFDAVHQRTTLDGNAASHGVYLPMWPDYCAAHRVDQIDAVTGAPLSCNPEVRADPMRFNP